MLAAPGFLGVALKMDAHDPVQVIQSKLRIYTSPAYIPKLQRGSFTAELTSGGIKVSNLANQPFLPWAVFEEIDEQLKRYAKRLPWEGDAAV